MESEDQAPTLLPWPRRAPQGTSSIASTTVARWQAGGAVVGAFFRGIFLRWSSGQGGIVGYWISTVVVSQRAVPMTANDLGTDMGFTPEGSA